jgi:hypothetical protein
MYHPPLCQLLFAAAAVASCCHRPLLPAFCFPVVLLSAAAEPLFCERFAKTSHLEFREWLDSWRQSPEGRRWLGEAALRCV